MLFREAVLSKRSSSKYCHLSQQRYGASPKASLNLYSHCARLLVLIDVVSQSPCILVEYFTLYILVINEFLCIHRFFLLILIHLCNRLWIFELLVWVLSSSVFLG